METGIIVLIVVVVALISFTNKMRKSWDDDSATQPYVTPTYEEDNERDSPYRHETLEDDSDDDEESLEGMPILDRVENFKFTQYTPPPFVPTTGSFEAVSTEDDLISSFDYEEENKATHANPITNFDLKSAVIFSEILKPKWNS